MTLSAANFESDIRKLIALGDLDGALAFIRFLVDHVRFDPAATGVALGSPALDRLCAQIGALSLPEARQRAAASALHDHPDVIILATELYELGGHSRVISDLIAAQPGKRHLILLSNFFDTADHAAAEGAASGTTVKIAEAQGRLDKLLSLQTELARHPGAQVFVFNHHGDAAAIAAIQPGLNREVFFCHHADYHLCLGTHLAWLRHVDFFAPCHHRCSEAGITAEYWPLSVPDRGARSHISDSFGHGSGFTSCTSGVWSKFDPVYPFHYADVVVEILRASGGRHLHIGGIPEEARAHINANLAAQGIASDRFLHVAQVPSVWDALLDYKIDLYIGSFPLGGGRATTEALGAGVPVITHRHHLDAMLGASGLGPADTWSWSVPHDLTDILRRLTPAELARRSHEARQHYLQHHSPKVFNACVRHGKSAALPRYIPLAGDRLLSYLLRSAVREESHAAVFERLHERQQALVATNSNAVLQTTDLAQNTFTHATVLYDKGKLKEAGALLARLHENQPNDPQVLVYLGLIALRSHMATDANVFFEHAISASQDPANTSAAIGQQCLALGEPSLATQYLEAATRSNPALVGAWALLADAMAAQGQNDLALAMLKPLLKAQDVHPEILLRVIRLAAAVGDTETELITCLRARQSADCHSRALQLMSQRGDVSAVTLRDETRKFVTAHADTTRNSLPAGHRKRLRVGFVFGRMAANDVARRLEPLLCDLDTARFETILFFDEIHDATTAQRFALIVDESHAISGMDAAQVAHLVRSRSTDVFINLEWHAHLPALMVCAQRAAPVQINFSEPPRTSALANMDYLIADSARPAMQASDFSERVLLYPLDIKTPSYTENFATALADAWQQSGGTLEGRK